jgi:hypothetical protein
MLWKLIASCLVIIILENACLYGIAYNREKFKLTGDEKFKTNYLILLVVMVITISVSIIATCDWLKSTVH